MTVRDQETKQVSALHAGATGVSFVPEEIVAPVSSIQGVQRLVRTIDSVVEQWIGWSWPPVDEAIAEAGWYPDPPEAYCRRCGESIGQHEASDRGCTACRRKRLPFDVFIRLGRYENPLRDWICDAKYRAWPEMDDALGRRLGEAIAGWRRLDQESSVVVPVPMPWQRRLFRGLDHSRVIADAVAAELGTIVCPIFRKSNGVPQALLSATERKRGRDGWINSRRRIGGWPLDGLDVVLVDDVRTTGTTLATASRLLKSLGAQRVIAAVLAVADAPGRRSPARASNGPRLLPPKPDRPATKSPQSMQTTGPVGTGGAQASPNGCPKT